ILVEHARGKGRRKRDAGRREHPDLDALAAGGPAEDLLALHDALEQFAAHDPVKARLAELRFFAGLTLEQAAGCLDISTSTADRAWRYARAWLYTAMGGDESGKKRPTSDAFRPPPSPVGVTGGRRPIPACEQVGLTRGRLPTPGPTGQAPGFCRPDPAGMLTVSRPRRRPTGPPPRPGGSVRWKKT